MTTAVVTGAAGGIGRALATRLAGRGHVVHLADLAPTIELATELVGVPHAVDVGVLSDVERLAAAAPDARIVCLNAGIVGGTTGPPWEAAGEEWDRVLRVNLGGVVNGLRAFLPRLLATGEPSQVVITASLAGVLTFPGGGAYAASKHAVLAVAEQAAAEAGHFLVVPQEWSSAVAERTRTLLSGARPAIPAPTGDHAG